MHWFNVAWHWFEVHTGTVNEPGPYYGFFSGFGSDIGELAIVGGLIQIVRHQNCGVHHCWRIGRHEYDLDGAKHRLCRKHHPNIDHQHEYTAEEFANHAAAKSAPVKKPQARGPGGRFK